MAQPTRTALAPKPFYRRWIFWIGLVLVAVVLIGLYVLVPRTPPALSTATDKTPPTAKSMPEFVAERSGYYDTVWPSEHADLWRSHAATNAGLPANFDPAALQVSTAPLNLPTWGYTRAQDQIFVLGGSPAILDSFTQAIVTGQAQQTPPLEALGNFLNPGIPYVAKITPTTMATAPTNLTRGATINYTGGLVMHQNGYVYAVSQSVLYKINPDTMQIVASVGLPLVGNMWIQQYWTTYNGMQVLANGELVLKGFNLINNVDTSGYFLLVNPDTLRFDVQQDTVVSSARLMIQQNPDSSGYLYHVNALDSLRFQLSPSGLQLDDAWTRAYRAEGDGTTQASSPMLFGPLGQVVFANNTAATPTKPISLFTQPVDNEAEAIPGTTVPGQPAFSQGLPSFNFFMVGGDPFQNQLVIYYDPLNSLVSAHRVMSNGELEPVWERTDYKASASPAIVPDRNLLYTDNYKDGQDWLVVLELSTGKELATVQLDAKLPTIGTIFPGMNNDVYLLSTETGTPNGLVNRIFAP